MFLKISENAKKIQQTKFGKKNFFAIILKYELIIKKNQIFHNNYMRITFIYFKEVFLNLKILKNKA